MRDETRHDGGVYRCIFEHAPDALFVLDENGRVAELNGAARALGVDLDALLVGGRADMDLTAFRAELLGRGRASAELRIVDGDAPRWLAVEGCAQGDFHVVVVRDVTDRRALDDELRHLRRVDSLGYMTAAVAHDFNNLLVPIVCSSALLSKEIDGGTSQASLVEEIRTAAEQAATLVRQMLAFVRREPASVQRVDVASTIERLRPLVERVAGDGVEVIMHLDNRGEIVVEREQLEHVVLNLAANARDAMPRGGRLEIRTSDVRVGDETADEGAPELVVLSVSDTGIGMSPAIRERIFDRFYTTKEPGVGTGIGLATAHRFVTQSGGGIAVHTAPGKGTSVVLRFPRAPAPSATLAPPRPSTPLPKVSASILVVEDDDRVRAVVRAVLEDEGYAVTDARSGEDGLRVAREQGPFDLVLADVVMPGLSGVAFVERLRESGLGHGKVLFMSGHTDDAIGARGVLATRIPILRKAFSPSDLANKVREVLLGEAS